MSGTIGNSPASPCLVYLEGFYVSFVGHGVQCPFDYAHACSNLSWLYLNVLTCTLVYTFFPCPFTICQTLFILFPCPFKICQTLFLLFSLFFHNLSKLHILSLHPGPKLGSLFIVGGANHFYHATSAFTTIGATNRKQIQILNFLTFISYFHIFRDTMFQEMLEMSCVEFWRYLIDSI